MSLNFTTILTVGFHDLFIQHQKRTFHEFQNEKKNIVETMLKIDPYTLNIELGKVFLFLHCYKLNNSTERTRHNAFQNTLHKNGIQFILRYITIDEIKDYLNILSEPYLQGVTIQLLKSGAMNLLSDSNTISILTHAEQFLKSKRKKSITDLLNDVEYDPLYFTLKNVPNNLFLNQWYEYIKQNLKQQKHICLYKFDVQFHELTIPSLSLRMTGKLDPSAVQFHQNNCEHHSSDAFYNPTLKQICLQLDRNFIFLTHRLLSTLYDFFRQKSKTLFLCFLHVTSLTLPSGHSVSFLILKQRRPLKHTLILFDAEHSQYNVTQLFADALFRMDPTHYKNNQKIVVLKQKYLNAQNIEVIDFNHFAIQLKGNTNQYTIQSFEQQLNKSQLLFERGVPGLCLIWSCIFNHYVILYSTRNTTPQDIRNIFYHMISQMDLGKFIRTYTYHILYTYSNLFEGIRKQKALFPFNHTRLHIYTLNLNKKKHCDEFYNALDSFVTVPYYIQHILFPHYVNVDRLDSNSLTARVRTFFDSICLKKPTLHHVLDLLKTWQKKLKHKERSRARNMVGILIRFYSFHREFNTRLREFIQQPNVPPVMKTILSNANLK
jgi:hypothetical protein